MQNGKIVPFRGCERRSRGDDRGGRWPVQMLITVGLLGFVCGVLYVSAPLRPLAPPGGNDDARAQLADSVYYPNCAAARSAGAAPLRFWQPGYRAPLDADGDGVACEPYRPRY